MKMYVVLTNGLGCELARESCNSIEEAKTLVCEFTKDLEVGDIIVVVEAD